MSPIFQHYFLFPSAVVKNSKETDEQPLHGRGITFLVQLAFIYLSYFEHEIVNLP